MSKFLQLKPHGYEIIVLLLIVGAYFGIREVYGDIFRGDGYWKTVGFALCFGALIITIAVALATIGKHDSISFVSVISLLCSLALIWYVFDAANPETQFRKKKQAYIDNVDAENASFSGKFMAFNIQEEFLSENEVSKRLFNDLELIGELMRDLQPRTRWHSLAAQKGYDNYFDESLICYASLRENGLSDKEIFQKPNGENVFSALTFMHFQIENENFIPIVHQKLQPHFEHFKSGFVANFKQLIDKELNGIAEHNLYEMEMLLYFLTQKPTKLSDKQFVSLMDKWKSLKLVYKENLEELISARNELKSAFEGVAEIIDERMDEKVSESIGIKITDGKHLSSYAFKELQPIMNLTGFTTDKGNDVELVYISEVEKMMEKKDLIYKTETKSRRVEKQPWEREYELEKDLYRTETYKEQKIDRVETIEVYKNSISLSLNGKILLERMPEYLPNQFLDVAQKGFSIEPWEMNRGESIIFALPQKWF